MNVQQFFGSSMRDVLTQVRSALGEDALILETRETDRGFEVAAVTETPAGISMSVEQTPAAYQVRQELSESKDSELGLAQQAEVREEMKSIRSLVESHLAHVGWNETYLGSPLKASVMRNLSALGIAPDVVSDLLKQLDSDQLTGKTWAAPMKLLTETIPVIDMSNINARRLAVVGPTGAGKTTTIAGLAARYAIENTPDKLRIVSLDNHRPGACEQIDALARLIGVAILRPVGDRGVDDLSEELKSAELTMIDTVGLGQHDTRISAQLARLGKDVCTLLVLPANIEHDAMQDIVNAYSACKPAGVVLTKVDEASSLGAAISVLLRSGLPLAWVSDGQRIPDDLHSAVDSQAWLVKHAVELMRKRSVSVSERYMAENFFAVGNEERLSHG